MTLIQPNQTSTLLFKLLGAFVVLFVGGVVALISLYSSTVSMRHELSDMKTQLQNLQADNAEMKDSLFTMMDAQSLADFAAAHNLVKDTSPKYLQLTPKWEIASQQSSQR